MQIYRTNISLLLQKSFFIMTRTVITAAKKWQCFMYSDNAIKTIGQRRSSVRAECRDSNDLHCCCTISVSLCAIWRTVRRNQQTPVSVTVCGRHYLITF